MRTGRGIAAALLLALVALALAACGGDDGSGDDSADSDERVSLQLTQPTDGATVNADSVEVAGTVTPGANVNVNSRAANVAGKAFRATVAGLDEGRNSIDVRAVKAGMQPASASVTVTRTATPAKQSSARKDAPDAGDEATSPAGSGRSAQDSADSPADPAPAPAPARKQSVEARLRAHLRRYDDESWYRSVSRVTVRKGAATVWTRLGIGTASAKRQAGRICRAVNRFRLPKSVTIVLVSGRAGVIVRYCRVPGVEPRRL